MKKSLDRSSRKKCHLTSSMWAPMSALLVCGPMVSPPLAWAASDQARAVIQGQARVVDGDTLAIGDKKIRMWGIDAPEKKQSCRRGNGSEYMCGLASKQALEEKIRDQSISCQVKEQDQYGRFVAQCSLRGEDLNAWMVAQGDAVSYKQYSKQYVIVEERARAEGNGIWEGEFVTPSIWRKQQKVNGGKGGFGDLVPEAKMATKVATLVSNQCPDGSLTVKGNVNKKGSKLYYTPDSLNYGNVKIDEGKGERIFCSVQEAEQAGWSPAK